MKIYLSAVDSFLAAVLSVIYDNHVDCVRSLEVYLPPIVLWVAGVRHRPVIIVKVNPLRLALVIC